MKKIILLNGPSSSGKSSIARELCLQLKAMKGLDYSVISIDDFLKTSRDEPIYEDDVFDVMPDMSKAIANALTKCDGVIVDHVITSERIYRALLDGVSKCGVFTVKVSCSPEILVEREEKRGDRCTGSAAASEQYLFPKVGYDMEIDTSASSAKACAEAVFNHHKKAGEK